MNMWCPDGIGRDSWDRGEPASVIWPGLNSPQEFGGRNLFGELGQHSEENGTIPIAIVIVVVECYCFLIIIIVGGIHLAPLGIA